MASTVGQEPSQRGKARGDSPLRTLSSSRHSVLYPDPRVDGAIVALSGLNCLPRRAFDAVSADDEVERSLFGAVLKSQCSALGRLLDRFDFPPRAHNVGGEAFGEDVHQAIAHDGEKLHAQTG